MKPIKYPKRNNQPLLKVNPNNPIELLAALIVGIPLVIIGYAVKYPVFGYILVVVIITVVFFVIRWKRKKRAEYLKWFYDRNRRIQELNANDYIDLDLTNAIINAANSGKAVAIGQDSKFFQDYRDSYEDLFRSQDIRHSGNKLFNSESDSLSGNGIAAKSKPLIFRYVGENNGGYAFYIFNETVLAFIEGPEKRVFLAAYRPNVINYNLHWGRVEEKLIVHDKTQYNIRHYYKHNPVPEAEIESATWEVVNKDGSRSFRGGLLPEHNPLIFRLRYGALELHFGDFANTTYFSNVKAFREFAEVQGDYYKRLPRHSSSRVNFAPEPEPAKKEEDVFSRTTASQEERRERTQHNSVYQEDRKEREPQSREDSIFSRTDVPPVAPEVRQSNPSPEATRTEEPKEEAKPVNGTKPKSLDEGSTRARNKDIASSVVDDINKIFAGLGRYSFKTYQVRKPRTGWGMQDAGVYTYTKDSKGNEYTIEFDLHTNLEIPKTDLKFSVWGKTKDMVAERYNFTVTKAKMKPDGDGFSLTLPRDYESMTKSAMTAQFEKDILTLMKLIEADGVK